MAYFPMFVDMTGLRVLVVGGGHIAAEKLEKLVRFTKEITVVSKEIGEATHRLVKDHCLTHYLRPYRKGDIDGFDVVIVATDTVDLHKAIYEESRGKRIWVNSVDDTAYCDFIFPSFVKKGDLTVAFSTSGASPAFAKHLRAYCESALPDEIEAFLQEMRTLRETLPKGKERMQRFDEMTKAFFKRYFEK